MSAFSKFMKLFSMAGGVRSKRDPVTGGIDYLLASGVPFRLRGTMSLCGKTAMGFGNSFAKQNAVGYPGAAYFNYNAHFHWANAFLGAPLVWSRAGGVGGLGTDPIGGGVSLWSNGIFGAGGYTSNQLLPYFDTYIGTYKPDVVFLNVLENDILTMSADASVANVMDLVTRILGWGGLPIVVGAGPSTSFNTQAFGVKYFDIDARLAALETSAWVYVSIADIYTDGTTAGAQPLLSGNFANYTDGVIHPKRAAILIGSRIADKLESKGFTGWWPMLGATAAGSKATAVIGRNLMLSGATGTVSAPATGQVATAYTGNATNGGAAFSKVLVDGIERQRSAATYSGTASTPENNIYGTAYETTGYIPGESYVQPYWDVMFDAASLNNWQSVRVQMMFQGASASDVFGFHAGATDSALMLWPKNRKARLYAPEQKVPAGTTGLRSLLLSRAAASVTAAAWTFDVMGHCVVVRP